MTLFKAAVFTLCMATAGLAQAELTANIPLDTSRFEIMSIGELTGRATGGDHQAQFYLAKRYQKGVGVAKDTNKAVEWYTKAGNENVTPAQLNLGLMYALGKTVAVDEQKARYWLERAAKRGDNRASYTLALIDEKQSKLTDAYKWYSLSARDGMLNDDVRRKAQGKIGKLAMNLSSSDIANANSKAVAWFQSE